MTSKAAPAPPPSVGFRPPAPRRRRALVGLTPLIDVVFILLIFSMLASSFLDWRTIALDAPSGGGGASGEARAILVEVGTGGPRVNGEAVPLERLGERVRRALERTAPLEGLVRVRPLPGVPLAQAVAVLDRLTAAGVERIGLAGPAPR